MNFEINFSDKFCCFSRALSLPLEHSWLCPLIISDSSQADRIYLNAGGIQFNNQSRKGRVATKSRRRVFEDTAFSTYLNPGP